LILIILFLIIVTTIYINTNYLFPNHFVPINYYYTYQDYRHIGLHCSQHFRFYCKYIKNMKSSQLYIQTMITLYNQQFLCHFYTMYYTYQDIICIHKLSYTTISITKPCILYKSSTVVHINFSIHVTVFAMKVGPKRGKIITYLQEIRATWMPLKVDIP